MHSHLSSLGWSPTNPRMVTHQKEVYYRLGIWQLNFTCKKNTCWQLPWMVTYHPLEGYPPTMGWSPRLAPFGPIWPRLVPFGPVWPHFGTFGPVWPCLAPFVFYIFFLTRCSLNPIRGRENILAKTLKIIKEKKKVNEVVPFWSPNNNGLQCHS